MLQKNDSLHVLAESYARDTNEINVLISLAKIYLNTNPDSSFIFSNEAFSIAEKWKINKKICSSYLYMGNACGIMGNYPVASEYFLKSLSICEKTGDKTGQGKNVGWHGSYL